MRSLLADLRLALRSLAKDPAFTLPAALTLALGIGAAVAIFGVVDAVLLKALPYREPSRLARLGSYHETKNASGLGASCADLRDWQERNRGFEALAGILGTSVVLDDGTGAAKVDAAFVSAGLFPALGMKPLIGRWLRPEEDREGGPSRVALVSDPFWKSRLGGDPGVLGRSLSLDGVPYEIVGVAPDDALLLEHAAVIAPLVNQAFPQRSGRALDVVGRLRESVGLEAARADMAAVADALEREYPEEDAGFSIRVVPLQESLVGGRRFALFALAAGVLLLLLIACANAAGLLVARATRRRHELGVRMSLGATRMRIASQLLAESLALACVAGAAGLLLGEGLLAAIRALAAGALPRVESASVDPRTALFALTTTLGTALLFGAVPAFTASGRAMGDGLRVRDARAERGRTLDALVVVQTALCLVLLVGAGLLGRSYLALSRTDTGLKDTGAVSMSLSLPRAAYREPGPRVLALERVVARLETLPGVAAAGLVGWLPTESSMTMSYSAEGHPRLSRARSPQAEIREVSERTFAAAGIPVLSGRAIEPRDRPGAPPVVVVSRQLAARLWPGETALGKHLTLFADGAPREVVGVVGDVKRMDRTASTPDQLYVSYRQAPIFVRMSAIARSGPGAAPAAAALERAVHEVDPTIAVSDVKTLDEVIAGGVKEPRFRAILVLFFAVSALVLASVGLYGVIGYAAARRRFEMGVRMALGATPARILSVFVGSGVRLAALGALAGLAASLAAGRLVARLLYGVPPSDPATFAASAGLLLGVAALASLGPALRAAKGDPLAALRAD